MLASTKASDRFSGSFRQFHPGSSETELMSKQRQIRCHIGKLFLLSENSYLDQSMAFDPLDDQSELCAAEKKKSRI